METTREKLINITFDEIYSHGYQGSSLSDILAKAGVHKGSMYHFFSSKKEMALASINEKMLEKFNDRYTPIYNSKNGYLQEFFSVLQDETKRDLKRGCPIANIVQEMSNIDVDFNALMKSIYKRYRMNIKIILDKAIQNKELKNCNTEKLALFISSALEGAILAAKATGNEKDYTDVVDEIIEYIGVLGTAV